VSDNELSATYFSPPSTGLSSAQFSTLNSAGINDPEGQEKYNNIDVKNGATFYHCYTAHKFEVVYEPNKLSIVINNV
jgi:hypothetical protein